MTYLIFAEERDLPYELWSRLAEAMAESPELVLADATYQLHNAQGILAVPEAAEAARLSARFAALGAPTFLLEALLEPPPPEPLHLKNPDLEGALEIAAAGSLHLTTQRKDVSVNLLNLQLAYPRIPIPGASVQETTVEEQHSRYSFDVFLGGKHRRAQVESLAPLQRLLGEVDLSGAYLGAGVRRLQAGERRLPVFASEHGYDRYLTWLYQLKHAIR